MSAWDKLYSLMVGKLPYKVLMVIPPLISIIMVGILVTNGLEMGLDFRGGTWIEIHTPNGFSNIQLEQMIQTLEAAGLEEVDITIGWDIDTGLNKLAITTVTVLDEKLKQDIKSALTESTGILTEFDVITTKITTEPPVGFSEKINNHLKQRVDLKVNEDTLTISSINLNQEETERALEFYLKEDLTLEYSQKNFNSKTVGATLGKTFRQQAVKAVAVAFILMAIVIFVAFRDVIPSFAVMLAAGCDIILTMGTMSILGLPLEPASLAALLMLIGYSVDSDILLTVRVLKQKKGDVKGRIDDAMKTGLTMTGTTLAVMVVVYIVSTTLTQIFTLQNIASVLLIGLIADLFTTYFTNAGILLWYLEKPKTQPVVQKKLKRRRKKK